MKMNILVRTGDKEAERATRRISRDQVSFVHDSEVMNDFVKEGHTNFGSPLLQGPPA